MGEEFDRPTGPPSAELFEKQVIYKQKLEERASKAEQKLCVEEQLRKNIEDKQIKTLQELQEKTSQLELERGSLGEYNEKLSKVTAQKTNLEHQLSVSEILEMEMNQRVHTTFCRELVFVSGFSLQIQA